MYRGFKQDMIACLGEFVGTTMFIFLGLGCVKTAQVSRDSSELQTTVTLSNQSLVFISLGMGFSLLITAWVFYRITGGLFNPAVTFSLWLIGSLKTVRAILLTIVQFAGGIAGSALVAGLTSGPGVDLAITKLEPGMSKVRGTFLEAFLTAMLVFTVLMLAAEKHKATYLAPIGIGLTLFVCQLFATLWTGCGMNPARSLGPSAVAGSFPGYHWIYYVGPYIGSLIATTFYWLLKSFDYTSVVSGQDSSDEKASPHLPARPLWTPSMGFTRQQRTSMLASGMHPAEIERREAETVDAYNAGQNGHGNAHVNSKYSLQPRHSDATMVNMHPSGPVDANGTSLGIVHQNEAPAIRQVSQGATKTTRKTKSTGTGSTGNHAAQDYRHATTGTAGAPHRDASPMQPMMQDTGGIAAPGAHSAGLGNVPIFKKVLGHTNHNAHR